MIQTAITSITSIAALCISQGRNFELWLLCFYCRVSGSRLSLDHDGMKNLESMLSLRLAADHYSPKRYCIDMMRYRPEWSAYVQHFGPAWFSSMFSEIQTNSPLGTPDCVISLHKITQNRTSFSDWKFSRQLILFVSILSTFSGIFRYWTQSKGFVHL